MVPSTRAGKRPKVSRRDLIQAGIGGMVVVAGCAQQDSGSTDTEETETTETTEEEIDTSTEAEESEPIDPYFVSTTNNTPEEVKQWNPWNPTAPNLSFNLWNANFEWLTFRYYTPRERRGVLLEDWGVNDGVLTAKLREDYVWSDGDPVTAEDLAGQWLIDGYVEQVGDNRTFENVRTSGEYTVEVDLIPSDINESIAKEGLLEGQLVTKRSEWDDWVTQLKDASSDDGVSEIINNLQSHTETYEPGDFVSLGPLEYTHNVSDITHGYSPREEYPGLPHLGGPENPMSQFVEDEIEVWFKKYGETGQRASQIAAFSERRNKETDTAEGVFDPQLQKNIRGREWAAQFPANLETWSTWPWQPGDAGLVFNHNRSPLDDRLVRKAIMHATPTRQTTAPPGETFLPEKYNLIMPSSMANEWLGESWITENLEKYPTDSPNSDKVAQYLEDAGLTKEGGQWRKPDGSEWTMTLRSPSWGDRVSATNIQADLLQDMGINAEAISGDSGNIYGPMVEEGDYDGLLWFFGSGGHPWNSYDGALRISGNKVVPDEWPVPMPIGDPDGSIEMLDIPGEIQKLRSVGQDTQERLRLIAWAFNQTAPVFDWTDFVTPRPDKFIDKGQWDFPKITNHQYPFNLWMVNAREDKFSTQFRWGASPKYKP